jgi:glycogen operon protein
VSYAQKHNQANGEDNRDGMDENYSANYGIEGPSDDPAIETLRRRQIKNLLATLMLSRGVPMLLGGDEFRRSQGGNNNAYCQDNEISWVDWSLLEREQGIHQFTRDMIRFRKHHPLLSEERFYADADITWFDPGGAPPDWFSNARTLGCHLHPEGHRDELCLLFNAEEEEMVFTLPRPLRNKGGWHRAFDTSAWEGGMEGAVLPGSYRLAPRSLAVLSASV